MDFHSPYLSIAETAVLLRKFRIDGAPSTDAIRGLLSRGVLSRCKVGRTVLIARCEIEALLAAVDPSKSSLVLHSKRGRPTKLEAMRRDAELRRATEKSGAG